MKIAYLGSKGLPSKSGTERVVEAVVSRLSTRHEITVYCDSRYTPAGTCISGINLVRVHTPQGKHVQALFLFFASAVHALFKSYDVIHLQGVDSCFILPILRLKYKVVTTAHGTPGRLTRLKWGKFAWFFIRAMEYPFVYFSNQATSVSYLDAEYLKERYRCNVTYIPNGVDEHMQADTHVAGRQLLDLGIAPESYLLFAAGRIDPTKGCHLVLEALNQMGNPHKLIIIGDLNQVPPYSDHLREIADKQQVIFLPPIADRALLFGLVKQARLFIFPSSSEGMSMMLLEAAALQVPVLCSDIPENKIVLPEHALYFRSNDSAELARQIQWAWNHPQEMADFAQKACQHVNQTLVWEKIARQYEEIYRVWAR